MEAAAPIKIAVFIIPDAAQFNWSRWKNIGHRSLQPVHDVFQCVQGDILISEFNPVQC
jgi:hypothetical protein